MNKRINWLAPYNPGEIIWPSPFDTLCSGAVAHIYDQRILRGVALYRCDKETDANVYVHNRSEERVRSQTYWRTPLDDLAYLANLIDRYWQIDGDITEQLLKIVPLEKNRLVPGYDWSAIPREVINNVKATARNTWERVIISREPFPYMIKPPDKMLKRDMIRKYIKMRDSQERTLGYTHGENFRDLDLEWARTTWSEMQREKFNKELEELLPEPLCLSPDPSREQVRYIHQPNIPRMEFNNKREMGL